MWKNVIVNYYFRILYCTVIMSINIVLYYLNISILYVVYISENIEKLPYLTFSISLLKFTFVNAFSFNIE